MEAQNRCDIVFRGTFVIDNITRRKVARYTGSSIARDHRQIDRRTTVKNNNRNIALERSVINYWGWGLLVLLDQNRRPVILLWYSVWSACRFPHRSVNHHRKQENLG